MELEPSFISKKICSKELVGSGWQRMRPLGEKSSKPQKVDYDDTTIEAQKFGIVGENMGTKR